MPDREDQHDVLGRQPAILRDITVRAARQDELPPAIFGYPTQQRVVRENLKCRAYTRELRQRPLGINVGYEIEQALQIAERAGGYFDARHERARGRRGFLPPILAAR